MGVGYYLLDCFGVGVIMGCDLVLLIFEIVVLLVVVSVLIVEILCRF